MSEVQGLDTVLKQLDEIANLDWVSAQVEGLEVVAEEARQLVPVDTGALQSTIRVETDGDDALLIAGDDGVDYATDVEFGTIHMAAQPYMRPAFDTTEAEMLKVMANNLNKQMEREL